MHDGPPLPDDAPTPIVCTVCDGDWQGQQKVETPTGYRFLPCPWCLRGAMTQDALRAWQDQRIQEGGSK